MSKLLEAIKNKRQAIAAKSGRERPAKLTSAKNLVRLLPNWKGEADGPFSQDYGQHFIKDKSGKIQAVYICTATTFGRECDVCAEIARHAATTHDEDMLEVLQEARSSSRILVNAIYMNGTHANAKTDPVLLELPVSVFNDILGIMETYLEDHGLNILDLNEGHDLVINKSGAGRETKYTVTPSPKSRAIPADVLEKARDLEAYAQQEHQAALQKALASLGAVAGALPNASAPALGGPGVNSQQQRLAQQAPVDLDALEADSADLDAVASEAASAPAAAPAAVEAAPAAESINDDLAELDALLAAS